MLCRRGTSLANTVWSGALPTIVVAAMMSLTGCLQNRILTTPSAVTTATTSTNGAAGASGATGTTGASGATGTTGSTGDGPVAEPVVAGAGYASVTNFGDSITCGYYATPGDGEGNVYSQEGYAGVLDAKLAMPAKNLCRMADMAADMTRNWVYPNTNPALGQSQLYTMLIGVNDANFCGGGAPCISDWSQEVAASLAWLALPATDKVLGTAMKASAGAWSADMAIGEGAGEATTKQGASLSFTVTQAVAGRSLHLAYRVFAPWLVTQGAAVVAVDGVPVTTLSSLPNTGLWIDTFNHTTDTIFLASVPLGAVGEHTVTVTTTSADGGFFSLLWAGVSSGSYATVAGAPRAVIGTIATTTSAPLNAAVDSYNAALLPMVSLLVADGMNITVAPTAHVLDIQTDYVDEFHPNNGGHAKVAAAFAGVL